ncbi:MAG: FAD-binding oxidoreductase [Dehalococcoidales bacterium]|nr:FAD-binding oxidoreductase [Dehalococcoidales bacterium]
MLLKMEKKQVDIISDELKNAIGANKVKDDDVILVAYASDSSYVPFRKPNWVVLPETRDDVVEVLKIANKYKIPVTAFGRGVNIAGYGVPSVEGMVLDLRRMDKIVEINIDSGYAVIEPGVTFDQFAVALAEKGFRCPMPTGPGGGSPIGTYLMRPSQSLVTKRLDPIVDLEVVLADGTVFNTGSSHFPNGGNGLRYGPYPDLSGIFCYAYATMGIVTRASVTIYPINEANRVNVAAFDNFPAAVDFAKDIINNNIPEHTIIWNFHMGGWTRNNPSLAMADPRQAPAGIPYSTVTTMLSGYEETMISHEKVIEKVARKYGGRILSPKDIENNPNTAGQWGQIFEEYHPNRRTRGARPVMQAGGQSGNWMAMWVVMAEAEAVKNLEKWVVNKAWEATGRPINYYVHPFDFGRSIMFRIVLMVPRTDQELVKKVLSTFQEMTDVAMERYGAIPLRHKAYLGNYLDMTGTYADVLGRIKNALDPNNILNRDIGIFPGSEQQ